MLAREGILKVMNKEKLYLVKKIPNGSSWFSGWLSQGAWQFLFAVFIPLEQFLCLTGCLIFHAIVLEMSYLHFKIPLDTNDMQNSHNFPNTS